MKSANLIVFIDALPYKKLDLIERYLKATKKIIPLTPEQGYSSNQHVALFSGKLPNEIGYFTDYTLNLKHKNSKGSKFYLNHNNFINFLIRKVLKKFGFRGGNIPLGLGGLFINNGFYPLANKETLTKLNSQYDDYEFRIFRIEDEVDGVQNLHKDSLKRKEFIVLNSLDHAGHVLGSDDSKYESHLIQLLQAVDELCNRFVDKYPDGKIIVLSDHGMSHKPKKIKINLEKVLGPQSKNTYYYFIDSSVLKVWVFNSEVRHKLIEFLSGLSFGEILDESDREYYGIGSEFGDVIFVIDSKYYFEPQYFGFGLLAKTNGMHGSLPAGFDQKGVLCTNYPIPLKELRNKDVYKQVLHKGGFVK